MDLPLGHQPVRGATVGGNVPFPAVWMAVACLGLGLFLLDGVSRGRFEPQPDSLLEPWMLGAMALLALLVGVTSAVFGVGEVRRALLRSRARDLSRSAFPWTWDHPWRREGAADGSLGELAGHWVMAAAWCLLLSPFVAFTFFPGGEFSLRDDGSEMVPTFVRVMVGIFAVVGVLLIVNAVRELLARLWGGRTVLHYHAFPYFLGSRVEVTLETPRAIGAERLTVTLRCIRERVIRETYTAGQRDRTRVRTEFDQLYVASTELDVPGGRGSRRIPIGFQLPADAPATRLSDDSPTYWRLDVGLPGKQVGFLVPVYAATAAA